MRLTSLFAIASITTCLWAAGSAAVASDPKPVSAPASAPGATTKNGGSGGAPSNGGPAGMRTNAPIFMRDEDDEPECIRYVAYQPPCLTKAPTQTPADAARSPAKPK